MSPSIWTRCAASSEPSRRELVAWRVVEAQHVVATRKLVDSDAEQQLLEELIESAKPPLPAEAAGRDLHYLLTTPFRYPPLRHGSRFAERHERSLWYGSRERRTAFAETAYYRLLFLDGTAADLEPLEVDLSVFRAWVGSGAAVDLTAGCFDEHRAEISSPSRYDASQRLGGDMRRAGVELFLYRSARDAEGGVNVALFTPSAFTRRRPSAPETWYCIAGRGGVEVSKRDVFRRASHGFPRRQFEVRGTLPAPAP
jgi:hypothetical protein